MVTRLGMWPNTGPKVLLHRQIRSCGSHTTMESVVSPPGVAINSRVRSPACSVSRSLTSMSAVSTLCAGSVPNRRAMAEMPSVSRSRKANALRATR